MSSTYSAARSIMIGAVIGSLLTLTSAAVGLDHANAQPYGGCKEAWSAPQSEGADWCRDHGWTVRPRLVVGPKNWVRHSTLPSCTYEDASSGPIPCSWNFGDTDGNGEGGARWASGSNESPVWHVVKGVR